MANRASFLDIILKKNLTSKFMRLLVVITCLQKSVCQTQIDLTLDENAVGPIVTQAVIAKLDHIFRSVETDIWKLTHSTFMRTIAYVETRDGCGNNCTSGFSTGISPNGIWNVSLSRLISEALNSGRNLDLGLVDLQRAFNLESADSVRTWLLANISQPMVSALGARIVLLYSSLTPGPAGESICSFTNFPTSNSRIDYMAEFWYYCYRRQQQNDDTLLSMFKNRSRELLEIETACTVNTDIAFVLDASGSITRQDWESVRSYVHNVTSTTSAEGNERVAIITFSEVGRVHLNFTNNQRAIQQTIDMFSQARRSTNTADGLCKLLDQNWRENVLRIAIVMTDGRSNENSAICGNTSTAIQMVKSISPAIILLVVAVGNNVDNSELRAIASSNSSIYNLDSLRNELGLATIEEEQSYEICHTASAPRAIGKNVQQSDLNKDSIARYAFQLDQEGITIRICVHIGLTVLYGSYSISNPNKALHDFALDAISRLRNCQDIFISEEMILSPSNAPIGRKKRQEAEPRNVYIAIEGRAENGSSFSLETTTGDTTQYMITCDNHPCGRNTYCTMSGVGYKCSCIPGYSFGIDLFDCMDINECQRYPPVCSQFASCENNVGNFTCKCIAGYTGDGVECIINQNTEQRFIVIVACGVGGGVVAMVVVLASLIAIYKTMRAKKDSQYHQRDDRQHPADPNLNVFKDDDKENLFPVD